MQAYLGTRAHALNVIDPTVAHVASAYAGHTVGLIGTKQTVGSGVYAEKLAARTDAVALKSFATPLLAPMIEEGFYADTVADTVVRTYLDDPALTGIEALVLACTHYPLIRPQIEQHYAATGKPIDVLDPSALVAQHVEAFLTHAGLCAPASATPPAHQFYVSDYTDAFAATTRLFFGTAVTLEPYALWE